MPTAKAKPPRSLFSAVLTRPQPIVQGKPLSELLPPAVPNRPLGQDALVDIGDFIGGAIGTADPFGPTSSKAAQLGALVGSSLPVLAGIRAFHGSPHKFSKFSLSKIGTGEGAQSYGRGLYFAEAEQTGKYYKDALGGTPTLKIDNHDADVVMDYAWSKAHTPLGSTRPYITRELEEEGRAVDVIQEILSTGTNPSTFKNFETTKELRDEVKRRMEVYGTQIEKMKKAGTWKRPGYESEMARDYESALAYIDKMGDRLSVEANKGYLYEVDIDADPSDLLDWDVPIIKQNPKLLDRLSPGLSSKLARWNRLDDDMSAIQEKRGWGSDPVLTDKFFNMQQQRDNIARDIMSTWGDLSASSYSNPSYTLRDVTGQDVYDHLTHMARKNQPKEPWEWEDDVRAMRESGDASDFLKSRGVPGIKYWDGMSRSDRAGTRNFVIFDDSIINILKQTGILLPVTGAAISSLNRYGPGPAPQQR